MASLNDFGIGYYGALILVLVSSFANLAWVTSRKLRNGGSSQTATSFILAAFGIISTIYFAVQFLIAGDIRSIMAITGALIYLITGVATKSGLRSGMLVFTLGVATVLVMQGSQIRFFVDGSRYDYRSMPWGHWLLQCFITASAAVAILYAPRHGEIARSPG